jgi:hypothetical protein
MRFCKPELDSVDSLNVDPCHPEQEILYSSESALADEDERMSPKAVKGEGGARPPPHQCRSYHDTRFKGGCRGARLSFRFPALPSSIPLGGRCR